jgi:two-component system sensor kinase FixL
LVEQKSQGIESPELVSQLLEVARISALTELASGIAHELNQPLGAIATFAQAGERMLNRESPMVSQALDVLRQINEAALGAGEGIRRIRRLFDQDVGARTSCQIPQLIEELKPILELFAQRIGGKLSIDLGGALPTVNVDRLRIQQVIVALVQNACDASAQGKTTPRVGLLGTSDRYTVEIAVTDSGTGVPESIQRQLFRPFFTTKQRGTGLGLASSKAIIEAHEGTMGFNNVSSGGSRFWFRLPVAADQRT